MKKKVIIILVSILVVLIIVVAGAVVYYNSSLKAVNKNGEEVVVTIETGSSASQIAQTLQNSGVVKNALTFRIYTKLNKVSGMQAGTYKLNKNMDVEQIISTLKKGTDYYPDQIKVTFLEGKNMRWVAKTIASDTNNTEESVFDKLKDATYIDSLISKYWFLTDEIKDKDIYYALEGYFFPDTYTFDNKDVTVEEIFETMLDQMEDKLEPYKAQIQTSGADVHKLLTLASVVELEASNDEDRAGVASVFYNRIKSNMALGSDVTTYYAIKVDMSERDLYQSELNKENPYNTRGPNMQGKLPIGPIASVGIESIKAAINPENTEYLYFVADKNGKVYFAKTLAEHERNVANLKTQGLWYSYE